MANNNLACRIWTTDMSPHGQHRCHAESMGLNGNTWFTRERIEEVLAEKSQYCGNWQLRGCEPNDDGSNCVGCKYERFQGAYS